MPAVYTDAPEAAVEAAAEELEELQADRAPAVTPLMAAAAAIFRKPLREILFMRFLPFLTFFIVLRVRYALHISCIFSIMIKS